MQVIGFDIDQALAHRAGAATVYSLPRSIRRHLVDLLAHHDHGAVLFEDRL
jgi:hypothetical protein